MPGTTELMRSTAKKPDLTYKFLSVINDFIINRLDFQMESLPSIEGIFILDDIVDVFGDQDFKEFEKPYLHKIYYTYKVKVKFFHNDAFGLVCAP